VSQDGTASLSRASAAGRLFPSWQGAIAKALGKGIGDTTVAIFLRELRRILTKAEYGAGQC